jgi:beta-phosphoglucomutase family hydrolase
MTVPSALLRGGPHATVWVLPSRFDAVLFDLDGVLTDTARLHLAAWREMFAELAPEGPPLSDEEYLAHIDGRPREEGLRAFLDARGIRVADEVLRDLAARKDASFRALLEERGPDVIASSADLLRHVREAGMHTGVVSASRNAAVVLDRAGLAGMVDVLVDGLVAEQRQLSGKPDPATFLEAAHRVGCSPRRCVVVEDSTAGVMAGRAGAFGLVLGLDRSGRQDGPLLTAGADVVVVDLAGVRVPGDRR